MQVEQVFDERGRKLAVKRASTPDEAARLRREADLLEIASHPGLVELIDFSERAEAVLRTGWVDGASLAECGPLGAEEIAGVAAAVASTLADLHELGLVHGAVSLDHVVLGNDGRPILCSLGCGGLVGERAGTPPRIAADAIDPARDEAGALQPAVDVYGLGAVVTVLLDRADGPSRGASVDALRRLASRARAAVAGDRPTARALADALHDDVPGARLPSRPGALTVSALDPLERRRRERPLERWRQSQPLPAALAPRRRWTRPRTIGLALLTVSAAGGAVLVGFGRPDATSPVGALAAATPQPSSTESATAPSTTSALGATTVPDPSTIPVPTAPPIPTTRPVPTTGGKSAASAATGRSGCPPVDGPLAADVDGDGCADALRFVRGVVEGAGMRFAVGEPGDLAAVGDWSCTGSRSLALLRPRTGEVFAFTGWASLGHTVDAVLVTDVPGGRSLRAADLDGDGCNEMVVERDAGSPVVARLPRGHL